MPFFKRVVVFILLILPIKAVSAEEEPVFEVRQLAENIYEFTADGGGYTAKVVASVGEDGTLIVDAGQEKTAGALKTALAEIGDSIPEFIINTHAHIEHTGGNLFFGPKPVIIGHTMLRKTLKSGSYLFDDFTDESLPEITFTDSMSLYFNGEEIKLLAFPGAHDNSDIIVWFTKSKIACVGALSNGTHFPSVDGTTGDILKYPLRVKKIMEMLPEDVTIVPGHGEDHDMDGYRAFYAMLVGAEKAVHEGLAAGKDLETMQQEDALAEWSSFEGGYVDKNGWIEYLVKGLQGDDNNRALRVDFFEKMYRTYKEDGPDAAVRKYYELRDARPADKPISELELIIIAYKLYDNRKFDESIKFFELSAKEFPGGGYPWLCYNNIGSAYRELGNKEKALENYRKSLELNSDNTRAEERIKELAGE